MDEQNKWMKIKMNEQNKRDEKIKWKNKIKWMNTTYL
jgi:hypothetical protein